MGATFTSFRSGYPQFRANRTPFLRYASEQPSQAAATIPSPGLSFANGRIGAKVAVA